MYHVKEFAECDLETLHSFIKTYRLATVITSGPAGPEASLLPVCLYNEGKFGTLRFHLAKANPQTKALRDAQTILILFRGPDSYVTPDFYATRKNDKTVIPTWNYTLVEVRGKPTMKDDPAWILRQITDLINTQDAQEDWKFSEVPRDFISQELEKIIGVEVPIEAIEGKFKVSQNQPEENQKSVVAGFLREGNETMARLVADEGFSSCSSEKR